MTGTLYDRYNRGGAGPHGTTPLYIHGPHGTLTLESSCKQAAMTHMPGGGCTPRVMAAEERRRPSQSLTIAASPLVTPPADRAAPGPAAPLRRPPTSLHPLPLRRGLALLRPSCRDHNLTWACVLDKDANRALQQLLSVSNTCSGQVLDFSNTSSHPLSPFRLVSAGSKASK